MNDTVNKIKPLKAVCGVHLRFKKNLFITTWATYSLINEGVMSPNISATFLW